MLAVDAIARASLITTIEIDNRIGSSIIKPKYGLSFFIHVDIKYYSNFDIY